MVVEDAISFSNDTAPELFSEVATDASPPALLLFLTSISFTTKERAKGVILTIVYRACGDPKIYLLT